MAEQEKEISNYEFKDFSISSVNKDAVEEYSFLHLNERTPFCAEKNDEKYQDNLKLGQFLQPNKIKGIFGSDYLVKNSFLG